MYLGMLAATYGDLAPGEAHFEHALAMNEARGAVPWVAHTCNQCARMLRRRRATATPNGRAGWRTGRWTWRATAG